jgi:hypothetical protein
LRKILPPSGRSIVSTATPTRDLLKNSFALSKTRAGSARAV